MHKWNLPYRKDDVESGGNSGERPLYPTMLESPELRWGFIRKVYSIIAFQLLLTIAVAATVVTVRPIAVFFSTTSAGLALWIVLIITPLLGKALLTRVFSYFRLSLCLKLFLFLLLQCCVLCTITTRNIPWTTCFLVFSPWLLLSRWGYHVHSPAVNTFFTCDTLYSFCSFLAFHVTLLKQHAND